MKMINTKIKMKMINTKIRMKMINKNQNENDKHKNQNENDNETMLSRTASPDKICEVLWSIPGKNKFR